MIEVRSVTFRRLLTHTLTLILIILSFLELLCIEILFDWPEVKWDMNGVLVICFCVQDFESKVVNKV